MNPFEAFAFVGAGARVPPPATALPPVATSSPVKEAGAGQALESSATSDCEACNGKHRKHTCGKVAQAEAGAAAVALQGLFSTSPHAPPQCEACQGKHRGHTCGKTVAVRPGSGKKSKKKKSAKQSAKSSPKLSAPSFGTLPRVPLCASFYS